MRLLVLLGLLAVGSSLVFADEVLVENQLDDSLRRALRVAATTPQESSRLLHSAYQTGRNISYRDAIYPKLKETCRQIIRQQANQLSVSAAVSLLYELDREDGRPRDSSWVKPLLSSRYPYVRLLAADILWKEGEKGLAAPVLLSLFTDEKVQDEIVRDALTIFAVMHPEMTSGGTEKFKEVAPREVMAPLNDRIPEVVREEQRAVLEPMLSEYRTSSDHLHELATLYALEKTALFSHSSLFQDIGLSIKALNSQHFDLQDNARVEKAIGEVEEEMLKRWKRSSPFAKTVPASLLKGIAPWEFSSADEARAGASLPGNSIQRKFMLKMMSLDLKAKWQIRNSPGTVAPAIMGPLKALQEAGPKSASERQIRKAVDALRTAAEGAKESGSPIAVETANAAADILIDAYRGQPRSASYPYLYIVEFVAGQSNSSKTRDFLIEVIDKHPSEEAVRALSYIGWGGQWKDDKILYDSVFKIHQRDGLKGERNSFVPIWTLGMMNCQRTQPITIELLKAIPNLSLPHTYLANIIQTCFPEGYYETLIPRLINVWAAKNPRVETQHVQVYDEEISDSVRSLRYPGYTRKGEHRLPELTLEKALPIIGGFLKSEDSKLRHASYEFLYQMARMEMPTDRPSVIVVKKFLGKEKDSTVLEAGKRCISALESTLPK